jgi:GntR family transcriptional repressor for pyruvate dehydrogenase complex
MTMVDRVPRVRLSEHVTQQLVDEIVGGRWQASETLPTERELALRFEVSVPVVRESMNALSAKGLVRVRHGVGAFVTESHEWNSPEPLSLLMRHERSTLLGVHEVRTTLELEIAPLAAVRASEEQVSGLAVALDDMVRYCDELAKHCTADLDFHLRLARATGNPMFAVVLQPISALIQEGILRGGGRPEPRLRGIREHRTIYESVRRHDPTAAREAMAAHMKTTHSELVAINASQAGAVAGT